MNSGGARADRLPQRELPTSLARRSPALPGTERWSWAILAIRPRTAQAYSLTEPGLQRRLDLAQTSPRVLAVKKDRAAPQPPRHRAGRRMGGSHGPAAAPAAGPSKRFRPSVVVMIVRGWFGRVVERAAVHRGHVLVPRHADRHRPHAGEALAVGGGEADVVDPAVALARALGADGSGGGADALAVHALVA